jgi:hypothetical protein
MRLKGKVASIAGGEHGMGEAEAQIFAEGHFDAKMTFAIRTIMKGYEAWTLV